MKEISLDTEQFTQRLPEVADVYIDAFSGYPWFESLSYDVVSERLNRNIEKPGFQAFIAQGESQEVLGCLWFDVPSLKQLEEERGSLLSGFAADICETSDILTLVWEREVMVRPENQGRNIGTKLRTAFIGYIGATYKDGAVILTRMRDDNLGIIKIAEKLGFQRSGIRVPSSQNPEVDHEYWYNVIK